MIKPEVHGDEPPFKLFNRVLLSLQTLGFATTLFAPALFGFLISSSVGLITFYVHRPLAGHLQFGSAAVYGTLYVAWVYVHLKRNDSDDCVLQRSLARLILLHNCVGAAIILIGLFIDTLLNGGWFVMCTYVSVPALPIIGAIASRDWEGTWLIMKAFPVFMLASPSFVAFLPAYSAARAAALNGDNDLMAVKLCNLVLTAINLSLMAASPYVMRSFAFLPSEPAIETQWPEEADADMNESEYPPRPAYAGSIELLLILAAPWILEQILVIASHLVRPLACCTRCACWRQLTKLTPTAHWRPAENATPAGSAPESSVLGRIKKHMSGKCATPDEGRKQDARAEHCDPSTAKAAATRPPPPAHPSVPSIVPAIIPYEARLAPSILVRTEAPKPVPRERKIDLAARLQAGREQQDEGTLICTPRGGTAFSSMI